MIGGVCTSSSNRLDKWLWATRWCKTRQDATEACRAGWARREDGEVRLKPAQSLHVGDIIKFRYQNLWRTLRVEEILQKRVGAPLASRAYTDLTPPEDIEAWKERRRNSILDRVRGSGRPTKKERREHDRWF